MEESGHNGVDTEPVAPKESRPLLDRVWGWVLAVGPGIFCIGYTVGTGSVTTMCKTGSLVGMDLLWLLGGLMLILLCYSLFRTMMGGRRQ